MKKKQWVIALVMLALVIAAVFPVRAAVREYRYQKHLAEVYADQCKNMEYLKLHMDWMEMRLDEALHAENGEDRQTCVRDCYTAASDVYAGIREAWSFCGSWFAFYGDRLQGEPLLIYKNFHDFFTCCDSYFHGALEEDEFAGVMAASLADIRWMKAQFETAFPGKTELSDEEFVQAWTLLFETEVSRWCDLFSAARTAVTK